MIQKKPDGGVEWIGGIARLSGVMPGDGKPYHPHVLLWINPEGRVLGSTVARPGESLALSSQSLQNAIENPMIGSCPAPTRVRVASPVLAELIRVEMPAIEVVCAPTPELDEVAQVLQDVLGVLGDSSYLSSGIEPFAVESFFRTTARLFRTEPWKLVPEDQPLIEVTIEALAVEEAPLLIIGTVEESFGFILCENLETFHRYRDAVLTVGAPGEIPFPPHLALSFERGIELAPELMEEIDENMWEIAASEAYPTLLSVGEDCEVLPLMAEHFEIGEVLCLAFRQVLRKSHPWCAGWNEGREVEATLTVDTYFGDIDLTLRAPLEV